MTDQGRVPGSNARSAERERVSDPLAPTDFPVFAVREWAARFYEQEQLKLDGASWRVGWPFGLASFLAAGAVALGWRWPLQESEVALGGAVVLAAAAIGVGVGGVIRWRAVRVRRRAATSRPATVESLPEAARAVVLDAPRLRFRQPVDGPGFAAARDHVAAQAPVGAFAAGVLVWAVAMRGRVDGTLEEWVRGRQG